MTRTSSIQTLLQDQLQINFWWEEQVWFMYAILEALKLRLKDLTLGECVSGTEGQRCCLFSKWNHLHRLLLRGATTALRGKLSLSDLLLWGEVWEILLGAWESSKPQNSDNNSSAGFYRFVKFILHLLNSLIYRLHFQLCVKFKHLI